jgi:hypothetical protein
MTSGLVTTDSAGVKVLWSRECSATVPGFSNYNAFQSLSYVARVELTEDPKDVAVVVLHPGAATYEPDYWHDRVVARARELIAAAGEHRDLDAQQRAMGVGPAWLDPERADREQLRP